MLSSAVNKLLGALLKQVHNRPSWSNNGSYARPGQKPQCTGAAARRMSGVPMLLCRCHFVPATPTPQNCLDTVVVGTQCAYRVLRDALTPIVVAVRRCLEL